MPKVGEGLTAFPFSFSFQEEIMQEFNETDETEVVDGDPFSAVEIVVEKKRGRPKKVEASTETVAAEAVVNVKEKKAELAVELAAQKAFGKAQPFKKQWTETINGKVIQFTRAYNGNVYKQYISKVGQKKRA